MILVIDNLQYTLPLLITILKVLIMWGKKEGTSYIRSYSSRLCRLLKRSKEKMTERELKKNARRERISAYLKHRYITVPYSLDAANRHDHERLDENKDRGGTKCHATTS